MDEITTQDRESPDGCPSQSELAAFNRGRLPAQRTDSVADHIGMCQRCAAALRELSDDSDLLIARLRDSHTDELAYVQEPGCVRLEARARALFSGSSGGDLKAPLRLGQYELVRRIKGGGMGDVHEARHVRLDRRVALKTLRADRMHDPRLIARFQREMAAVGKVNHPNVVHASDAGDADGWHFLVMDYVDGLDLAAIAKRCGTLPIADAAEIGRQTALGLQNIHEHGFVHRDVKPSNLMLDVDGNVKILDLGLALLYEAPASGDELTESGVGMGTADYMSPEQALDSHQATIQSDLYSLGCALYKLLVGRAPFDTPGHARPIDKMRAQIDETPAPLRTLRAEIPEGLAAIVHRLLQKKPERRFATPQELAAVLAPFAAGHDLHGLLNRVRDRDRDTVIDTAAKALDQPRVPVAVHSAWRPRRWHAAAAIVAVLGCCIVAATAMYAPWNRPIPGAVEWPADFPLALQNRPWGKTIDLIWQGPVEAVPHCTALIAAPGPPDKEPDLGVFQPLWCERLAGNGQLFATRHALILNSNDGPPAAQYSVLALDDDRAQRSFEFDAVLWPSFDDLATSQRGIFFGWRVERNRASAYFIELDDRPRGGEPPTLKIKYVSLPATTPGRPAGDEPLEAPPKQFVSSTPLTKIGSRYALHLRVVRRSVTVSIDGAEPIRIAPEFETSGKVGIWCRAGRAWFSHTTTKALPP